MIHLFATLMLAVAAATGSPAAYGDASLHCTVASVHDGDSMRVRCPGERDTLRIRMHQIDAPELDQPHGRSARDQLRQLCPRGGSAVIRVQGRDQYDRVLGDVSCGNTNVNEAMVASGDAWVYERHATDRKLHRLQDAARKQRRGLWATRDPVAPWRWRYQQRQGN